MAAIFPNSPKSPSWMGTIYLDWDLQIKTLLRYHRLCNVVNDSEKKPPVTSSCSTTSVASSSKTEIEAWLDKDSCAHAFLVLNIKLNIAGQFQDTDEETVNELWAVITNIIELMMLN